MRRCSPSAEHPSPRRDPRPMRASMAVDLVVRGGVQAAQGEQIRPDGAAAPGEGTPVREPAAHRGDVGETQGAAAIIEPSPVMATRQSTYLMP